MKACPHPHAPTMETNIYACKKVDMSMNSSQVLIYALHIFPHVKKFIEGLRRVMCCFYFSKKKLCILSQEWLK